VIECHISNVHAREAFRHHSYISPAAAGIVVGFGVDGYVVALEGLVRKYLCACTAPNSPPLAGFFPPCCTSSRSPRPSSC
jgi:hypothetical protein